ncbi:hypothetical protein [Xanthomonas campestris]|uniref:hypothetical protein n=1 Tax=Xanthomonas campestris TaxID=339 RepID=UPI003CE8B87F
MTTTAVAIDHAYVSTFAAKPAKSRHTEFVSSWDEMASEDGLTSARGVGKFSAVVKQEPARRSISRAGMPTAEKQKIVRVDVQEIGTAVAECQIIQLGGQDVSVELPLELFPAPPRIGQSFDLQMIVENGIRRPQLTARPPNMEALRAQKDVLWDLVEKLAG